MGLEEIPVDLLKQNPDTGMYSYGGIEMTASEYIFAQAVNDMKKEIIELKDKITKLEGK